MRILTLLALAALFLPACSKGGGDKDEGKKASSVSTPTPTPTPTPSVEPTKRPDGPTGSLEGMVFLDGEAPEMPVLRRGSDRACSQEEVRAETIIVGEKQGLANVLVRIKPGTVPGWVPSESIRVDQTDCMYRPRVQGGVTGQTVQVGNSDATTHNVHARELPFGRRQGIETLFNRAQPAGVSVEFVLEDQDVAKLKCDYHGWMQGYVVISDNPYHGVSNKTGAFKLEGLPVGKHQLQAWHEYYGLKDAEVTIEEGKTATIEFRFDAGADKPGSAGSKPAADAPPAAAKGPEDK